jgi:hypothetical protein
MSNCAVIRALGALLSVACGASGNVVISPQTTLLIGNGEPVALQKAAHDLESDFGKVFGTKPRLVHRAADAGPVTICVSLRENTVTSLKHAQAPEVLQINAVKNPWKGAPVRDAIILTGSDLRGAIYAVYEFSQKQLGVDPLYYWTDRAPRHQASLPVPDGLAVQDGPPAFRHRGWFINDEDLLSGWKPGAADGTGIALEVWDKIFETILRLKGNMIVPGTFIFPDEPQVKAAADRGLIITQHHIEILGTNTYRWPDDKPYSYSAQPELMSGAWAAAVRQYRPDQEVIWTVGYRGRHDRAFWVDDASSGKTDAERAATIQRAIAKEMEIVRAQRKNPVFLMNAWMESVPFLQAGLLKLPEGVAQVWPDNGHGVIRDDDKIKAGEGVYYHTAMYNSMANQLTEMVPLERIERELGRAARANATGYLLINTSDIRPVIMTTKAVMELAWNPKPWIAGAGRPQKFLNEWCAQFGPAAQPLLVDYYNTYFSAPGRYGQTETATLTDNAYHTVAREMLLRLIKDDPKAPTRATAGAQDLNGYAAVYSRATQEAQPKWEKARTLAERAEKVVAPESRDLFLSHIRTQSDIHRHSNHMLHEVAAIPGKASTDEKLAHLNAAITDAEAVLRALEAAEYGKWRGFYKDELFVQVRHTRALALVYRAKLQGKTPPADVPVQVLPVDPYVVLKAYQGPRRVALR